jgi:hypothetical protein
MQWQKSGPEKRTLLLGGHSVSIESEVAEQPHVLPIVVVLLLCDQMVCDR